MTSPEVGLRRIQRLDVIQIQIFSASFNKTNIVENVAIDRKSHCTTCRNPTQVTQASFMDHTNKLENRDTNNIQLVTFSNILNSISVHVYVTILKGIMENALFTIVNKFQPNKEGPRHSLYG